MNIAHVVNINNVPFTVLLVDEGDRYGKVVKFYDSRYPHGNYGQFVTEYYASTLLEGEDGFGLSLYADVRDWFIDSKNMDYLRQWIREHL